MTITTDGQPNQEALSTPFAGVPTEQEATEGVARQTPDLESPFASLLAEAPDSESEEIAEFLESLEDEDFADALEQLIDEAALQHLAEQGAWSGELSEAESFAALESWIEPLAETSERAIDTFAEALEAAHPESLSTAELDQLLERLGETPTLEQESFDQFLGGIIRKVKKFARKAVRAAGKLAGKAIKAVGKLIPIGPLLKRLAKLVRPLLKRVLRTAIGRLPMSVRPLAKTLAARLGLGEAEQQADGATTLAEDFDVEVAALLFAPEAFEEELEAVSEGEEEEEARDAIGELDAGRARLAQQLAELPADATPTAEIQQFIPLVLAVRPLIKLGISIIGRDKVVRFLAARVAGLIKGLVGAQGARLLSPPLVDAGLRIFGFEGPEGQESLSGEALASTVEGTVFRTLDMLPPEALEDELQVDAAVQTAFAEAAAAYLPDQLLREDLAERETAGEGGVWVLLPRATRPRYRFRKFTRVYAVPLTRQMARRVPWWDGGSLEDHLLDRGVERWPVQTEIDLYEALPGTQIGHFTQDETLPTGERPSSDEFQPLTPDIAGQLLREPALGKSLPARVAPLGRPRPTAGSRYFRIRSTGLPRSRGQRMRRRRVLVQLSLLRRQLTVTLRLSERQAQQLLTRLQPAARGARRDLPTVLSALRKRFVPRLSGILVHRLMRRGLMRDAAAAGQAADRIGASVTTALSQFLTEGTAQLAAAVQDPANGLSISVTFSGVTKDALQGSLPPGKVTVIPGWRSRD
ncbi:hypothetical protein APR12_003142 [Nocardia amikacinitolerans]|uniref:hypothetical protein n=1 Tax=Nocardia amikacinitolerans TaxID=756689 RepID=UPI000829E21B|nr:hypothetical protein [Nocardia amikacinitolerans]MCP2317789.1 hypothetical protein [Nocardia amikacinitolerans]